MEWYYVSSAAPLSVLDRMTNLLRVLRLAGRYFTEHSVSALRFGIHYACCILLFLYLRLLLAGFRIACT